MNHLLSSLFICLFILVTACTGPGNNVNKGNTGEKEIRLDRISTMPTSSDAYRDTILSLIKMANKLQVPDSTLYLYKKALRLSNYLGFNEGMALSLMHIGTWYTGQHHYNNAIKYYKHALPYCSSDSGRCEKIRSSIYRDIGNAYLMQSQFDSAISWYERSLHNIEKSIPLDTAGLIGVYLNIAITLTASMEQLNIHYNRAFFYLNKAYAIASIYTKSSNMAALSARNLGTLYYLKGFYDSADLYFNRALLLYTQCKCSIDVQSTFIDLSNLFREKKNLPVSKRYLDSALNIHDPSDENAVNFDLSIGAYYYVGHQFEKTRFYYERALKKTIATNAAVNLSAIYKDLAELYDTMGNWQAAYRSQKKYTELITRENSQKTLTAINLTETKYRSTKMEKELVQKQYLIARQNNKIKNQYLWIGATLTSLIVLGGLFYRRQQKATITALKARLEGEEKERIRMAAELHDGIVSRLSYAKLNFDLLSPVGANTGVDVDEYQGALDFLEQSIAELRTTSQNMLPSALQRAGLLRALSVYCDQMSQVLPMRIDFVVEGELPPLTEEFELNIYRIVQELLNNVVKYAQAHYTEVVFSAKEHQLHIRVQDDGIGLPDDKLNATAGVGLFNLRNRLKILGGRLRINNTEGTTFDMDFDLKPHLKKNI